jgi:hypothetical protein
MMRRFPRRNCLDGILDGNVGANIGLIAETGVGGLAGGRAILLLVGLVGHISKKSVACLVEVEISFIHR